MTILAISSFMSIVAYGYQNYHSALLEMQIVETSK